jgi:hypothetical protein
MLNYSKALVNEVSWQDASYDLYKCPETWPQTAKWTPEGVENNYILNSYKYRTDEFLESRDFVFAGCSYTYGEGIRNDGVWGNILSDSLGVKSYNLGACGKSVQWIVSNLFNYFKRIGHPKLLICIFPEFSRAEMISERYHMTTRSYMDKPGEFIRYSLLPETSPYIYISKQPHLAENMIPKEYLVSVSIQYIKMLEMYCKAKGIELLWGTWSVQEENHILENNFEFENFVNLNNSKWHRYAEDKYILRYHEDGFSDHHPPCNSFTDCHQDLAEKYGKNFYIPFDLDISAKYMGHYGIHRQIHFAESFMKLIDDKNIRL